MTANVSAWSIRNPVPPVLLFIVLTALGVASFLTLPITRFPNIDVPVIAVTVVDEGAAPAELETQVAKPVEDALAGVAGVKHLAARITDGEAVVTAEFRLEVDTDRALNDVKDAVARIRADLPGTAEEPVIERIDVEGQAILSYAVASPALTLEELSWAVDDVVIRAFQGIRGVGRVERMGGVDREIRVALDPDRLAALGVTAAAVNAQLRATNLDRSGGRGDFGGREQTIRTLAGAATVADLADAMIALPGGRAVRLAELGAVTDGYEEPRSFARLDGEPVVAVSIYRAKGASDAAVAEAAAAAAAALEAAHPALALRRIDDAVRYTYGNFESAMETLIEGALLAVLVVFVFLRDWRATLIAAVALPLAAIPTFWAIAALGFSLNLVSLLAITLVTGILVDDAIVEIENIVRHVRMGKSAYRAALEAADEIGLAVIAITFTIIAVFAPVSFMGGIPGQYFKQFGLTVAAAVFVSLLVARLITPMMAAYLMRDHPEPARGEGRAMRAYTALLRWTLRWRWLTLGAGVGLFGLSLWSVGFLPTGFIPKEDVSRIVASVELPPGATLGDTRAAGDALRAAVADIPEIASVFVLGGSSPTGVREVRRATVVLNLLRKGERDRSQHAIEREVAARFAATPDLRFHFVNDRGERPLAVNIVGADGAAVARAALDLEAAMRRDPMFENPSALASFDRPEIRIRPRLDEAADLGVTPEAIAETVRVATIGDVTARLARFTDGVRRIPIRVQLAAAARDDLAAVSALKVATAAGGAAPLASVAEIGYGASAATISRFDRERQVTVGADMAPGFEIGQGAARIAELAAGLGFPPGVRVQETGDAEIQADVFRGFASAMGAGIMMVLAVLILLLHSFFLPLTILAALPLSVGGVVAALLVTHNAVSMPVVIGILMLMGIVTKNSIMLVDFAVEQERRGAPQREAVVDAGRKRARPIVMTTLAMCAGMLPSALGAGEGGEFRAPMAIAVIGGLLVSTVLSLIFIPSFYTIMDDLGGAVGRALGWAFRPNAADEPPAGAEGLSDLGAGGARRPRLAAE